MQRGVSEVMFGNEEKGPTKNQGACGWHGGPRMELMNDIAIGGFGFLEDIPRKRKRKYVYCRGNGGEFRSICGITH